MLGDLLCGDRQLFKMLMNDKYKTENESTEKDDDTRAPEAGKGGLERVEKMMEKIEQKERKKRKRGVTDKKDGRAGNLI
jgi:hypothetical protein